MTARQKSDVLDIVHDFIKANRFDDVTLKTSEVDNLLKVIQIWKKEINKVNHIQQRRQK
jgi:hypothetical protein